MILTDFDIAQRKAQRIKEMEEKVGRGQIPHGILIMGQPIQYFFAFETEDGEGGICGIDVLLLDVRDTLEPSNDMFYTDLAIISHLPGFYVEDLNVPVLSISLENSEGQKHTALCRYSDVDVVSEVMNSKFIPNNKDRIKLVIDNSKGMES